jgi:hypothetical protein
MTKTKIVVPLITLILSVPIIGFAQANGQGVPFKDFQLQIYNMQQNIIKLEQRIGDIEQMQGEAKTESNNPIAAHGVLNMEGVDFFPSQQFLCYKTELSTAVFYNILLQNMKDENRRPTCVVSPGEHNVQANYNLGMYGEPEFNTFEGMWEFVVVSQRNGFFPYKSGFSFICVQE